MKKFGLKKLLKAKNNGDTNDEKDIVPSEVTSDEDDHESSPMSETNAPIEEDVEEEGVEEEGMEEEGMELEYRKELFGTLNETGGEDNEENSPNEEAGDETTEENGTNGEADVEDNEESHSTEEAVDEEKKDDDGDGGDATDDDDDEEVDLDKMLEDLEIPEFNMSEEDAVAEEAPSEEGSIDYEKRVQREEIFSKKYRPSKSESKELEGLVTRLRASPSGIRLTTCQNTLFELLFGKHSIVLKRGIVNFNNHDCELFLLTDGFIAAYQNVNDYNPLESKYETCQLWSAIDFVEIANFGTLKIQTKSRESFQVCSSSQGEDLKTWFAAIEKVAILSTMYSSNASMMDAFGWQYQLIRKPAFTAAVTADMKLMGSPRNINDLDDYNQSSPLHYAIQREPCSADVIDALLRAGADPNIPDGEGFSAMYYAERNKLSDIEDILKQFGGEKSKLVEMELRGELFGGVEEAEQKIEQRREIEQAEKDKKAAEAAAKAESAQSIMSDNMNAMVERGEKIKAMDDKAQQLNQEAMEYREMAKQLNERMKSKNKKWGLF